MAAVARAGRSLALTCSIVTFTPACLPNSAACWSVMTSAAGTKLLHSRTCKVLVCAKAGALPPTNSTLAVAAIAILAVRKARRVMPLGVLPSWDGHTTRGRIRVLLCRGVETPALAASGWAVLYGKVYGVSR